MSFYKPYKFKKPKQVAIDDKKRRLPQTFGKEQLSGFIGEKEVSPIEERFARALRTNNIGFIHQFPVKVLTSQPGDSKFIDFLVGLRRTPVEVLGAIGHESSADRGKDKLREDLINQELMPRGSPPLKEVWWYDLEDQNQADKIVQELFG